jgi:hypothetical protein
MAKSKAVVTVLVVGAVAVAGYVAFKQVQQRKAVADEAIGNIQAELDGLDPLTRAAVVAKLSKDEVKGLRPSS